MQLAVRGKMLTLKRWQSEGTKEAHRQYREKNRQVKTTVTIAMDRDCKYWSECLQLNKGRAKMFKITQSR